MGARILPMGTVERITVHHEGSTEVTFADWVSTAQRLEMIRQSHLERLHAGDIGYHYVIDRAGNIWQGRDIAFQGAHVRDHNAGNVGVMVLGNFDVQRPTDAQLATLRTTVATLRQAYRVPLGRVYTHKELNPTECPGINLQGRMVAFRQSGLV
jgi:N-acetyl-anhydromuramyl-L-alanine amidase AmpD